MATKTSGLGDNLYISGYDVSGATQSLTITSPLATLDSTDISQSAHSRLPGLRSGEIKITTYHDVQISNSAHQLYSSLVLTDTIGSYCRGTTIGSYACSINAKQINYDPTRSNTGDLLAAVDMQANGFGLEWGTLQTAGKRTDTAATAGAAFDLATVYGAPLTFPVNFGAQAYLHAFSFTGTDATVKVQHSTTSGGAYTDLITFPQITGSTPLAQRATTASLTTPVNEFLKITTITTGGFTSLVFAVIFVLNQTATVF